MLAATQSLPVRPLPGLAAPPPAAAASPGGLFGRLLDLLGRASQPAPLVAGAARDR
jgi:hypothetical protein